MSRNPITPQDRSLFDILSGVGNKRSYPKNAVILNEGDPSNFLYLINSGRLKVYLSDEQGHEIVLNIMGPGEYFGEMALIDNHARSASVMTLEGSQLTLISKEDFNQYLADNPELATSLIHDLIGKLRHATKKIGSLALMDVYGRVANTLLQLATDQDGRLVVEKKLTHQEIANMVGASREMVSRIMHDLAEGGYISFDGKKRIVLNEKPQV